MHTFKKQKKVTNKKKLKDFYALNFVYLALLKRT